MAAPPGSPARRRVLFWAITLAGPPLLLLAVLEASLWILLPSPDWSERLERSRRTEVAVIAPDNAMGAIQPSEVPGLVYELKRGRRWRFAAVDVRTNSHGFRGPEFPEAKPAGVRRVVGLGDSVAFGWGVPEDETYLSRVGRSLAARSAGAVEVLNCAVPGYNSLQEAVLLRERVSRFSPDVVVAGYTLNDGEPQLYTAPPRLHLVDRSRLFELFRDLWRARLPPPDRDAENRRRIVDGLEAIGAAAARLGAPVVFLMYPQRLPQYPPEVPLGTARRLGFTVVDTYGAFERFYREQGLRGIEDVYLTAHDAHPDSRGHAMLAAALEPVLADVLARLGPSRRSP